MFRKKERYSETQTPVSWRIVNSCTRKQVFLACGWQEELVSCGTVMALWRHAHARQVKNKGGRSKSLWFMEQPIHSHCLVRRPDTSTRSS